VNPGRPKVLLALLGLGLLWGFSFILIKIVVAETGPVLLAAGRIWSATLILLPVVLLRRGSLSLKGVRPIHLLLAGGMNYVLPYMLIPYGETMIPTGQASVLNATMPLFTVCIGWIALRQRPTPRIIGGVLLGFAGVVLLTGEAGAGTREALLPGQLAVLGAALFYAAAAHLMHKRLAGLDPLATTFLTLASAAILILPAALASDPGRIAGISTKALAAWLTLGSAGTAIAYVLFFYILKEGGAVAASFSTYLFAVFALFWGWALMGETFGLATAAGTALVFGGIALARERGEP
jgi:drug/metabolite transporter (DMT)-like permease